jgi:hypothetical protein
MIENFIAYLKRLKDGGYIPVDIADLVWKAAWDLAADDKRKPENKSPSTRAWTFYSEAYKARYGVPPLDGRDVRAMMITISGKVAYEDLEPLMPFYLAHKDPVYVKAGHPPNLLLRDLQRLVKEMKTGSVVTNQQAKHGEAYDATLRAARQFLNREDR